MDATSQGAFKAKLGGIEGGAHRRRVGTGLSLRSLPAQAIKKRITKRWTPSCPPWLLGSKPKTASVWNRKQISGTKPTNHPDTCFQIQPAFNSKHAVLEHTVWWEVMPGRTLFTPGEEHGIFKKRYWDSSYHKIPVFSHEKIDLGF